MGAEQQGKEIVCLSRRIILDIFLSSIFDYSERYRTFAWCSTTVSLLPVLPKYAIPCSMYCSSCTVVCIICFELNGEVPTPLSMFVATHFSSEVELIYLPRFASLRWPLSYEVVYINCHFPLSRTRSARFCILQGNVNCDFD